MVARSSLMTAYFNEGGEKVPLATRSWIETYDLAILLALAPS